MKLFFQLFVQLFLIGTLYAQYAIIETFLSRDCSGASISGSGLIVPPDQCVQQCQDGLFFSLRTTCSSSFMAAPSGTVSVYRFTTEQCSVRPTSGVYMTFERSGCKRPVIGSGSTLVSCNSTYVSSRTCSDDYCNTCSGKASLTRIGACSGISEWSYVICLACFCGYFCYIVKITYKIFNLLQ